MNNLTYTDDLPQESGFYFRKDKRTGAESVVKAIWCGEWGDLSRALKWYSASTQNYVPFTENFQYAGPIERPEPKQGDLVPKCPNLLRFRLEQTKAYADTGVWPNRCCMSYEMEQKLLAELNSQDQLYSGEIRGTKVVTGGHWPHGGEFYSPVPKTKPTIEDQYAEEKSTWINTHSRLPKGCHMCRQTFDDLHNACGITGRTELVVRLGEFYHVNECVLPGKFLFV